MKVLKECGKTVIEDGGVMPNPTLEKLCEGVRLARENVTFRGEKSNRRIQTEFKEVI